VSGPSGKRAKFSHGPCGNGDAGFNFDPQVIAVAEEKLLHRLDCLDWIFRHAIFSIVVVTLAFMAVSSIRVRYTELHRAVQEFLAGVTPVARLGANFTCPEWGKCATECASAS
jgi:hypothetical protein